MSVVLLKEGTSGVSVIGVKEGVIQYQQTKKLIEQRHVSLDDVAFYEHLGVCFGRKPAEVKLQVAEVTGDIDRVM